MLAARPPATAKEPHLVSVRHGHLFTRVDVSDSDGFDGQPLARLDFMESSARVASMVKEAELPADIQRVDAHILVPGRPGAKMHPVAVVNGAIVARRSKQVHVSKVLADDPSGRDGSRGHQTAHTRTCVAGDGERTAFMKTIAAFGSKAAIVFRAEPTVPGIEASAGSAPFVAPAAEPPSSHTDTDGLELPVARIELGSYELHVVWPTVDMPLVLRSVHRRIFNNGGPGDLACDEETNGRAAGAASR